MKKWSDLFNNQAHQYETQHSETTRPKNYRKPQQKKSKEIELNFPVIKISYKTASKSFEVTKRLKSLRNWLKKIDAYFVPDEVSIVFFY